MENKITNSCSKNEADLSFLCVGRIQNVHWYVDASVFKAKHPGMWLCKTLPWSRCQDAP